MSAVRVPVVRRLLAALGVLLLVVVAGCGAGRPEGNLDVPAADAVDTATGVTTVTFWHSMDAGNGVALNALVDKFNAAHAGKIVVKPIFQGDYDTAITKYKASVQSSTTPSVIQIYDIGTQFMVDSGEVVPVAGFAQRDGYDLGAIQKNIAGTYTVGGTQWSMPLNSSVPLLYYNKTAFAAAGLDPDKPPQNLAEIRAAAEKLSKVNGGPVAYGFGAAIYGWFLEQFAATNGEAFCNADNGRTGQRVTAANMASPTITEAVEWWQKMVADGLAVNTGRVSKDAQDAFKAGQTAMTLESTGQVKGFTTAAKGKFELGAAAYPVVSGTVKPGNGPSIGGGSLWISGPGHSEAEKEASWQLAKFLAQPDSQAEWHTQTGYFPLTDKALDEPVDKEFVAANPLFQVAIDSLDKTEVSPATTGCAAGPMPQMRKALEEGLERALIGKDPKTSLVTVQENVAESVASYNESVGGS
ncbi:ABC transporter substrate-binding protein [Microlunatus antarcticus]|uniref:sn-glycerol 3-phosphate transport system substrate-binding protein n=1 Tax=Microlunatus antarcticus TaxID=53388 RepID=A0A7W5P922_9ACTN|nr:sn-glycerol 3-phosphate transport system substrate-binding protein [Microlunatus antarcticus]